MAPIFSRLVRFKDPEGNIHFGEAPNVPNLIGLQVPTYSGDLYDGLTLIEKKAEVTQILSPLPSVPLILGIGFNYHKHTSEATGGPPPKYPIEFTKSPDTLAGTLEDIPISTNWLVDYEGELSFILGKDVKDFKANGMDVSEYILGYTVGNDVSARIWQYPDHGSQHSYAKSFDKFAPIGPVIVNFQSPKVASSGGQPVSTKNPDLLLRTFVNGEERQNFRTVDMTFGVPEVLEHLSQGRVIRKGTVVMTGTSAGVGMFMEPKVFLEKGDVVEVEIEGIGRIENKFI